MYPEVSINGHSWREPEKTDLVYLGGAIDSAEADYSRGWRLTARELLASAGISTYDPAAAFSYAGAGHAAIVQINEAALVACDIVLLELTGRYPSVGTPVELYRAVAELHKPTVVWTCENTPVYVRHYAGAYCYDLIQACRFIAELRSNPAGFYEVPARSSRLSLVREG